MSDDNYDPFDDDFSDRPPIIVVFSVLFITIVIIMIMLHYDNKSNKDKIKQQDKIIEKMVIEDDFDVKDANYNVPPVIEEIKVK